MTATKTPAAKTAHACICHHVVANVEAGDPWYSLLNRGTGCMDSTKNEFAPGHDAKLKSFLIRAGLAGVDVSMGDGQWMVAEKLAGQFGFQWQVTRGIAKAKARGRARIEAYNAKSAAKATKAAAKTAKSAKTEKPLASNLVTAKVGRWEYRGFVDADGFHYTNAAGEARIAAVFNLG